MYPMENWYVPVMIGAVVGVIAGYFVARKSAREQKIHGGAPARALHYLGAAVFSGMPITSILTILMGGGFVRAVVTGFAIVGVSMVIFILFALVEAPHQATASQREDEGWTAQKAKESGL
ncbi:hypothetical protein FBR02_00600 [Anaerolineae bacterium CFX9]|nr:hypothetical protein [Anaerolineae bacterium CFX9]